MEEMREDFDTNTPYIHSPVPESVRRLAAQIKERYDSEEVQAFWPLAKAAILHGDEEGIYAWAERRIGRKPDFVIKVSYLGKKELGDATPRETWVLVDERGEKLAREAKGEPDDEGIAVFDEKSKTYPRLERIKSDLSDPDDWISEIAKAIWIAGAESPHGYPLGLGAIEWRIERDNRWRGVSGTPGEDSPIVRDLRSQVKAAEARATKGNLDPQEHREAMKAWLKAEEQLEEAKSFDRTASLSTGGPDGEAIDVEDDHPESSHESVEKRLFLAYYASAKNPAGLSPREMEVFKFSATMGNGEIAQAVGRPAKQIAVEKHRAISKIQKAEGL
jgi:hypothetical protein